MALTPLPAPDDSGAHFTRLVRGELLQDARAEGMRLVSLDTLVRDHRRLQLQRTVRKNSDLDKHNIVNNNIYVNFKAQDGHPMGIVERKERQKESLRQDILDAAREILLAEGHAKLSMRSIAKRIEYSPTTIYLYFKNKDEILHHLCEETLERQLEAMIAAVGNESSPVLRLRATLRAYIDFGLSEPDRYQITYMTDISQYVSTASILAEGSFGNKLLELVRHRLSDVLVESGSALDPEGVFQALWANSHGIVSLLITCPDFPWVERDKLIETNIDISLKGLLR